MAFVPSQRANNAQHNAQVYTRCARAHFHIRHKYIFRPLSYSPLLNSRQNLSYTNVHSMVAGAASGWMGTESKAHVHGVCLVLGTCIKRHPSALMMRKMMMTMTYFMRECQRGGDRVFGDSVATCVLYLCRTSKDDRWKRWSI